MRYKTRYIIYVLALLFITIMPAQARDKLLNIQEVTSPGGITAWLVEDHSVPIIALKFSFKGIGAALEPADKQGLARMASNTMDEGAGDLDSQSFQKALKDLSLDLHFTANRDDFGGNLKTLTKNKDRAFELLTLALTQPRFDEAPVTRMRNSNIARIRSSLSNPDWIAARILNDNGFAAHPYGQNSGGTLSTLSNITSEDLKAFAAQLSKDRLVVSVAGDISKEDLGRALDQIFGALPETTETQDIPDLELQNSGTVYTYNKDIPQTIVEIIQPGIDHADKDYHTAQVLNFILGSSGFGSRLTKEIREKRGLTYGIYTSFYNLDRFDGLTISTSTKNSNVQEMLSLISAEWDKVKAEPVSSPELKNAKAYLIGSLPLSLTSTDKIAGLMLSMQLNGLPLNYLQIRKDEINAARIEDIQRVAKRLLSSDKFVTVLVGKPEGVSNAETVETLNNVE